MKRYAESQDLVTVVTVTYNAEELLEETIQSVINQSYKNIEYIVIDAASADGTLDIINKYEDKIDYWVSEPDDGIYFAMNKAIEKATGKWINFMNAGDTFFDYKTVEYVMNHKDNGDEMVYGNCQIETWIKKPHDTSGYSNTTSICHQTLFAKTKLMKETPFDTRYKISADHNFILNMFQKNKKFQYIDRSIAKFLLNGLSNTQILRMQIEGLAVLFSNNVPENEIMQSPWYIDMTNDISKKKINHISTLEKVIQDKEKVIQAQEERTNHLSALQETVKQITNYSIWRQPLKKYKSYKAMLLVYHKISNSSEGDKVNGK